MGYLAGVHISRRGIGQPQDLESNMDLSDKSDPLISTAISQKCDFHMRLTWQVESSQLNAILQVEASLAPTGSDRTTLAWCPNWQKSVAFGRRWF
jgi:hypothetical protein